MRHQRLFNVWCCFLPGRSIGGSDKKKRGSIGRVMSDQ